MKQEIKQRWIGLRYWQRLGLKFSLLGIIVTGVFWKARPESLLSWILSLITRPALRLAEFLGDLGMYNFIDFFIPPLIVLQFFLMGTLLGLLIEKKKRKK